MNDPRLLCLLRGVWLESLRLLHRYDKYFLNTVFDSFLVVRQTVLSVLFKYFNIEIILSMGEQTNAMTVQERIKYII